MRIIAIIVLSLILAAPAVANNGTGSADFCERHCGIVEPGCPECPVTTCPDVTCEATDCSQTTVIVNPTPCPQYALVPCKKKIIKGVLRTVCGIEAHPYRIFLPESEAAQYRKVKK